MTVGLVQIDDGFDGQAEAEDTDPVVVPETAGGVSNVFDEVTARVEPRPGGVLVFE